MGVRGREEGEEGLHARLRVTPSHEITKLRVMFTEKCRALTTAGGQLFMLQAGSEAAQQSNCARHDEQARSPSAHTRHLLCWLGFST